MNLNEAARSLGRDLALKDVRGITGIGIKESTQEIVVYITKSSPTLLDQIPVTWEGFNLFVKVTGKIKPAEVK